MRRFLKFLHTIGAAGFTGGTASLLVLLSIAPQPASLAGYALLRSAMAGIVTWVLLPTIALTLIAGLLAIAANRAFHSAGWAWVKLVSGILVFEGFLHIQASMQEQAGQSAAERAGQADPAALAAMLGAERSTLWMLILVAAVNVGLGVWRPRLTRLPR